MTATRESVETVPAVSWADFLRTLKWRQGEHVAAIAPTGAGKTMLFRELVPRRKCVIMFGTKIDDPMYREFLTRRHGFVRAERFEDIGRHDNRILLWPRYTGNDKTYEALQQRVFYDAINGVLNQRNWTVLLDESKYMGEKLRMNDTLTFLLEQARSIGITVMCGAQRPVFLPRSVLANSTHVFVWKANNKDDAKTLSDVGGADSRFIVEHMKTLGKHEFLYVVTRGTDARIVRSQVGR